MNSEDGRVALRLLVEATSFDLLQYFARRTDRPEDAADLLGETLLVAWRRVSRLPEEPERARMWLFVVARNTLLNHRRSITRGHRLAESLRTELIVNPGHAERSSGSDEVVQAIVQLPPKMQEIVTLVHWEGFSISEAAQVVGINVSTARSRYAAAKAALREQLAPTREPAGIVLG